MPPRAMKNDPYRNFKFRLFFDDRPVAGMTKCSALTVTVAHTEFRAGEHPSFKRRLPGQVSFEPITLEEGVTADPTFQDWATTMANFLGNKGTDAEKKVQFRKTVDLIIYDLDDKPVKRYRVHQCWVSKYTVNGVDAASNDVLIHSLELQNEGIQALM